MRTRTPKRINEKFGRLTVIGWGRNHETKSGYKTRYWKCICDCGNIHEVRGCDLTSGRVSSCGCFGVESRHKIKNNLVGRRFGKLVVIRRSFNKRYKNNRCVFWKVICDCGEYRVVSSANLISGNQTGCGNCGLFRNGVLTSNLALKLHDIIGSGVHNYYTGVLYNGHNINVDIALVDDKIAIEYDGLYYHKGKEEWDYAQSITLVLHGWKVLRVRSLRNIPTKNEIMTLIEYLRFSIPQTIVLYI